MFNFIQFINNLFNKLFNKMPVANNDSLSIFEDSGAVNIDVLVNDTDPNRDKLTITTVTANNGSVVINNNGTLKYTPNLDFNGIDTIDYEISDGRGGTSTAKVQVEVKAVNDIPTKISIAQEGIDENIYGAFIGKLETIDVDDSVHTYSVDDDRFIVVDDLLKLKDDVKLNYEEENTVSVNITATDTAGESITQPFVFVVNDTDESNCKMGYKLVEQYATMPGEPNKILDYKFEYDSNGRVVKITADVQRSDGTYYSPDGNIDMTTQYVYDSEGNLLSKSYDSDEHESNYKITYTYDQGGRVLTESYDSEQDWNDYKKSYTYDSHGNKIKEVTEDAYSTNEISYRYNSRDNLIEEISTRGDLTDTISYNYDSTGNILLSESYDYETDDIIEIETIYSYDLNGNILSKETVDYLYHNDSISLYSYSNDSGNHTTTIERTENGQTTTIFYEYDQHDLLIASNSNPLGAVENYIYEYGCVDQNAIPYQDFLWIM